MVGSMADLMVGRSVVKTVVSLANKMAGCLVVVYLVDRMVERTAV